MAVNLLFFFAFVVAVALTAFHHVAAEAGAQCPDTCMRGCGGATPNEPGLLTALTSWVAQEVNSSRTPRRFPTVRDFHPTMTTQCPQVERVRLAFGIDVDAVAFVVACLSYSGASSASTLASWFLQDNSSLFDGVPLRANGDGWRYGTTTLPEETLEGFTFPHVALSMLNQDPIGPDVVPFDEGLPALRSTAFELLALLHADVAAGNVDATSSLAAKRFRGVSTALRAMTVGDALFIESPSPQLHRRQPTFVHSEANATTEAPPPPAPTSSGMPTPLPSFHPAPPFQSATATASLPPPTQAPTNAPFHPGPAFVTSTISRSLSQTRPRPKTPVPTTAEPTSAAPTEEPTTGSTPPAPTSSTLAPPATTDSPSPSPTAPPTALPTAPPPTAPPTTPEPSTTAAPRTPEPTTAAPPTTPAPTTAAPTAPPQTSAPATRAPQPPMPTNEAKLASQALMLGVATQMKTAIGGDPVLDEALNAVIATGRLGVERFICPLTLQNSKGFFMPESMDIVSGIPTVESDAFAATPQFLALASLGHDLDALCNHSGFAMRLFNETVAASGVRDSNSGKLIGFSKGAGGALDDETTQWALMAASRLRQRDAAQVDAQIGGVLSGSGMLQDVCWLTDTVAAVFSLLRPSTACGGPAIDIGLTALRLLSLRRVNILQTASIPTPPAAPTDAPNPGPTPKSSTPSIIAIAIGATVGGLVVVTGGAVLWRRLRRPKADLLLAPPTQNLGFF